MAFANIFSSAARSFLTAIVLSAVLLGCAKDRPTKYVVGDNHRFSKSVFDNNQGDFLFLKSVQDVKNAGPLVPLGALGMYLEGNRLVHFEITQTQLNVRAVQRVAQGGERPAELNEYGELEVGAVLASFPITHLDILRKQNQDGEDTHEEELTETRRPWNEREYIKIDFTADAKDSFGLDKVRYAIPPESVEIDNKNGSINFSVQKELRDGSQVTVAYSFMRFNPEGRSYKQKNYPRYLQTRFGFFKTPTYKFDSHGRITESTKVDYVDRWDLSKQIVYYLSDNYPAHLKSATKEVFASWNAAWEQATGIKNILELRENSGQKAGDLRYNMIYFDDSDGGGRLLGYGPSVSNPRTGEIVKADVFLYGGTLRRSVYSARQWASAFEDVPKPGEGPVEGEAGIRASGLLPTEKDPFLSFLQIGSPLYGKGQPIQRHSSDAALLSQFYKASSEGGKRLRTDEIYQEARAHLLGNSSIDEARDDSEGKNLHLNVIQLDADMMASIQEGALVEELSDAELEIRIFMPLLAHEMGHNFGLRHNFMASADKKHFGKDVRSSSVMDYAFAPQEPVGPGAYDVAALQYAYGSEDPKAVNALVQQNFFYCTDHEVFSSKNILCGQHDAGTNLMEAAQNMLKRYETHYLINNHRMDRAFFFGDRGEYFSRIATYVIPMRLLYDHADAIVRYDEEFRKSGQGSQGQLRALSKLWSLLRHRVEADPSSKTVIPFPVSESVLVYLDGKKLGDAVGEARSARAFAFLSLLSVLEGTNDDGSEKGEYDSADFLHHDLQTIGVLPDKILALIMLGARTGDPVTGVATTVYDGSAQLLAGVLRRMLSNTTEGSLEFFNPNLRDVAVGILTQELGLPGRLSAETMELIHLEPVNGSTEEKLLIANADTLRGQIQRFFVDNEKSGLEMLRIRLDQFEVQNVLEQPNLPDEVRARLEAKLKELGDTLAAKEEAFEAGAQAREETLKTLRAERAEVNVATVMIGHKIYKTPLNLKDSALGLDLNTATGDLIVSNINFFEDRIAAYNELLSGVVASELAKAKEAVEKFPEDPSKRRAVLVYERVQVQFQDTVRNLRQYVQMERQFVSDLLRKYSPF
ncbi:MAG: zinc-dependent metalloprotease [Bdellovibrionales bacterium]|nr:zinc-dependent metalloprotease [Bdellovibrionales bacterium]